MASNPGLMLSMDVECRSWSEQNTPRAWKGHQRAKNPKLNWRFAPPPSIPKPVQQAKSMIFPESVPNVPGDFFYPSGYYFGPPWGPYLFILGALGPPIIYLFIGPVGSIGSYWVLCLGLRIVFLRIAGWRMPGSRSRS